MRTYMTVKEQVESHSLYKPGKLVRDTSEGVNLCFNLGCPVMGCAICVGVYRIDVLESIEPALTWDNVTETIITAEALGISPDENR